MTLVSLHPLDLSADRWDAECGASGAAVGLQQAGRYGALAAARGRRVLRLELRARGDRFGLVQLLGRGALWQVMRGPVLVPGTPPGLHRAGLRALARRAGITLATAAQPVAGFGLVPLITPRHHAIWDLAVPEAGLRAGLAQKWRNRLARAERAGLRLYPERDPAWLIAAEAGMRAERGYRAHPPAFTADWLASGPRASLCLRVGDRGGVRLAGVLALIHGASASYHIGWTGAQGRACGAHNLALWQMALRLKEQGVRWLDLGEVETATGAGAGRARFKLGTGARALSLGATMLVLP